VQILCGVTLCRDVTDANLFRLHAVLPQQTREPARVNRLTLQIAPRTFVYVDQCFEDVRRSHRVGIAEYVPKIGQQANAKAG
jgi:hypothetical protein